MQRYLILCLVISSFFILLTSCAVKTIDGFKQKDQTVKNYAPSYFSDPEKDYVYKANVSAYGRDFGGIFIAKKVNDTLYRAAFTTEFGNKLFDFEVSDNSFKVNYILDELNKGIIVNTLKHDFMLLLKKKHKVDGQFEDGQKTVYRAKDGDRYNYLFTDKVTGRLSRLVNATKFKEKTIFTYLPQNNKLAKNIIIEHKNINLTIELNYLDQ